MISAKDFGAVGDGVTDDTKALQEWANQTEVRVLDGGTYLVSEPIVFAAGGFVTGQGNTLKLSDDFVGNWLIACKASEDNWQIIRNLKIDLNKKDVWVATEEEVDYVKFEFIHAINGEKFIDFKTKFEHEIAI